MQYTFSTHLVLSCINISDKLATIQRGAVCTFSQDPKIYTCLHIYIYILYIIFELWRNYDLNNIKPKEVDNEDLAPVYQKIIGGVNITLSDIRKYLYSCTRLFVQEVDEDLKSVSKLHNSRGNQDITSDFV